MGKKRCDVAESDKWNVKRLYNSFKEWEGDLNKWGREKDDPKWPEIAAFKGNLNTSENALLALIETLLPIERMLDKLYTYAHLRHDEDVSQDEAKEKYGRIVAIHHAWRKETAWVEPELLRLPDEALKKYLASPLLVPYKVHLEKIVRLKPHTLSGPEEALLALGGQATDSARRAFGALNDADLKFPNVQDSAGKSHPLTHATYLALSRSFDRTLRKSTFLTLHSTFGAFENTFCELISGQVHKHLFNHRARKYPSSLHAALFPHQIDPSVYHTLIQTVRAHLPSLHKYVALRKKLLKLDTLHLYDLQVPLVTKEETPLSYEEAMDQVIASVSLLGDAYQNALSNGLKTGCWVDRYENDGKRSGAYSSGCYDSMPYILMNFNGTFRDLTTLAHEAGHSMHSLLSNKHQPYHYSHYPIFLAEVASTFHEELLTDRLLSRTTDKEQKTYLINQRIDDIRATFFRQTMFAEFELKIHTLAEQGTPLTPGLLKKEYHQLNVDYFGPDLTVDAAADWEWARIPHFYYNFYVYQYATGLSAAYALFEKVKREGESARDRYLTFLSSGSRAYPLDLLQQAGVDMSRQGAILALIQRFDALVSELETLMVNT